MEAGRGIGGGPGPPAGAGGAPRPTPGCPSPPPGVATFLVVAALAVVHAPLAAQWKVAEIGGAPLELGGYVRGITAVHDLGWDPPSADRRTAFHGQVARLKWTLRGERWSIVVHDRLQARVSSSDADLAVVGVGVSAVPDRSLDLETTLVDEERFRVWHDLDRLALTLRTDAADLTLGRQAITWGLSSLFPVADLWSRFSPFEQDTEEKPGIDAVRALAYPAEGLELDVVVADRGSLDDLSGGVRAHWTLGDGDVYVAGGKMWREIIVAAGGLLLLDQVRLRAEAAFPFEPDGGGAARPRATTGVDWIPGDLLVTAELHYNGIGAADADGYLDLAADPRLGRGETYFVGRWYAGTLASWQATDRLTLAASALVNLGDPSASFTPGATYDVGQSARVSLGALLSTGDEPLLAEGTAGSEFGTYGTMGFTTVSVYF